MNNVFTKNIILALAAFIALPASAATVSLVPTVSEVNVGETFTVELYLDARDVEGPHPGNILGKPKVSFDSGLVDFDGFTPKSTEVILGANGIIDNGNNVVVDFVTEDYDFGLIGTYTFTALDVAGSTISFGVSDSGGLISTFFNSKDGNQLFRPAFDVQGDVSVVPIPASAWLLGSGLIGLFGWSRRRAAKA